MLIKIEILTKWIKKGYQNGKPSSTTLFDFRRMMVSLLAYNLVNFMKTICLPEKEATFQVDPLRLRLFKVAGKLVRSGRRLLLRMSSSQVYQDLFYQLLDKIQQHSWQE
ncbi:MAG: transposase [Trichococcus flocculiformis]